MAGGRGHAVADQHEAGLVLGVVLDLAGQDLEAGRSPRPDGCRSTPCPACGTSATWRAASAVELAATATASGRCFAIHIRVWPSGLGCDTTVVMSAICVPFGAHEVQRHRQVDLPLDEQLGVEGQRVEGDGDRALDRVLDRHEPEVDFALLDRGDHVRDVAERHRSPAARSACVSSASSANVPWGPRNPTRLIGRKRSGDPSAPLSSLRASLDPRRGHRRAARRCASRCSGSASCSRARPDRERAGRAPRHRDRGDRRGAQRPTASSCAIPSAG